MFAKFVIIRADEGLLRPYSLSDLIATVANEIRGDRGDAVRRALLAVGRRLPRAIAAPLLRQRAGFGGPRRARDSGKGRVHQRRTHIRTMRPGCGSVPRSRVCRSRLRELIGG